MQFDIILIWYYIKLFEDQVSSVEIDVNRFYPPISSNQDSFTEFTKIFSKNKEVQSLLMVPSTEKIF